MNYFLSEAIVRTGGSQSCIGGAPSAKYSKVIYLQDLRISQGGYWTQFKANARVFTDRKKAEKLASTFKYNNPKVICG